MVLKKRLAKLPLEVIVKIDLKARVGQMHTPDP